MFAVPNPVRLAILAVGLLLARRGLVTEARLCRTTELARIRVVTGLARMSKNVVDVATVDLAVGSAVIAGVGVTGPSGADLLRRRRRRRHHRAGRPAVRRRRRRGTGPGGPLERPAGRRRDAARRRRLPGGSGGAGRSTEHRPRDGPARRRYLRVVARGAVRRAHPSSAVASRSAPTTPTPRCCCGPAAPNYHRFRSGARVRASREYRPRPLQRLTPSSVSRRCRNGAVAAATPAGAPPPPGAGRWPAGG